MNFIITTELFWKQKKKFSISETKPRTTTFQKNHNNVSLESVTGYFEKVVTITLLDYLFTQLR